MEVQAIPEEVLFKAETIGHLPEEYTEPYVRLIKDAAESDEKSLVAAIDETVRSVPGFLAFFVLKPLIDGNDRRIKNAFFRSKELNRWCDKYSTRAIQMLYGT